MASLVVGVMRIASTAIGMLTIAHSRSTIRLAASFRCPGILRLARILVSLGMFAAPMILHAIMARCLLPVSLIGTGILLTILAHVSAPLLPPVLATVFPSIFAAVLAARTFIWLTGIHCDRQAEGAGQQGY